jgi:enoyl-CoA hydratase/carnithine racemase
MVCDLVVADEEAVFGLPEATVGLIPVVALARGRARLNPRTLAYLFFTGRHLSAGEAKVAGLVNVLTPAGCHLEEAGRVADAISAKAPLALAAAKHLLRNESEYNETLKAAEALLASRDHANGLAAIIERRQPIFEGS